MKTPAGKPADKSTKQYLIVVALVLIGVLGWFGFLALEKSAKAPVVTQSVKNNTQKKSGLKGEVEVQKRRKGARIILALTDMDDIPADGAKVEMHFNNLEERSPEGSVSLIPERQGRYASDWQPPMSGKWFLRITARKGKDQFTSSIEVNLD
jgi:hypothetical protein